MFEPCCGVPPADIGVVQVPCEDWDLQTRGFFQLSEGLNYFVLIRWSVADSHQNVTCVDLSPNPEPKLSIGSLAVLRHGPLCSKQLFLLTVSQSPCLSIAALDHLSCPTTSCGPGEPVASAVPWTCLQAVEGSHVPLQHPGPWGLEPCSDCTMGLSFNRF